MPNTMPTVNEDDRRSSNISEKSAVSEADHSAEHRKYNLTAVDGN